MTEGYFYVTAEELAARGIKDLPPELSGKHHLVYSSPATLAFNSPGAQGFGVKRAGLAVPESVMLLAAPRCCGRNTSALASPGGALGERFFYLLLDETDIVTGRHLVRIPEAVKEICRTLPAPPPAVMICITCVDALLGTDMERVCRRCTEASGVPVVPCYMYALTREGRLPPMVQVRKSVYSFLEPLPKRADAVNLLGFFTSLQEDCELYALLRQAGVKKIRELAPQAEIVVQETWSYTPWDGRLKKWGIDQNEMYAKLHAAYGDFAKANGFQVIPVGTAVQLYRKALPVVYTENSFGGDPCGSAKFEQGKDGKWKPKGDVFHFNREGHYLQALVWTASLFGVDVTKCPYKPDFLDAARAEKMKACAMKSVKGK